eukprot:PITA_21919
MPFRLMNVGVIFQRAMDIAFVGEKDKFVLIYLDDITIFSSSHKDHLNYLKKVFLKCRQFGISVNPKKSQFALKEGKLLGHIVFTEDVKIDPARVQAIQKFSIPRSKRDIQSFLGKINFLRRFIPNFAELIKHNTSMLKKGSEIKWVDASRRSFKAIKKAIMEAPTLISPNYTKELCIFFFSSYDTLAAVLLQKNDEGIEHLVDFFNKTLRDVELSIIHFLQQLEVPPGIISSQAQAFKLRSAKFCINKNFLYWKDPSGILLRCLDKEQVIHQFHSRICGGHHYWKTTTHKILRVGYYWPTLFSDVFSFVKSCDKCQRFAGRQQLKSFPLKPVHVNGPFQQWSLDFIGEFNPHSSGQHKWILAATDYFTKWIEAIPTKNANHQVVIKFFNENIFTRFGCPSKLVTDNGAAFKAKELVDMTESMGIQVVHSTSYYPQGNGLSESSNKSLLKVIKKLLEDNKKSWDSKMKFALWADRIAIKKSIGNSPFKLVYGADAVFSIQLILPVAKFLQEEQDEENDMVRRMNNLVELQ